MEVSAQQFLRSVRGKRSQVAFSRRLGYRSNPVADWEAGRRFPTAEEALRACTLSGIDLATAFSKFHAASAPALQNGLPAWLQALRAKTPIVELASRMDRSRFAVSRWLSGQSKPRLPDFFRLVEALTGRVSDLVAELVSIGDVPSLAAMYSARTAARALAFDEPWTEAILRVLETPAYQNTPEHQVGWIAARLGIAIEVEVRCIDLLVTAGVIAHREGHYQDAGPLSVDTTAHPDMVRGLKSHWTQVAKQRVQNPGERDLLAYNVVSLSKDDYQRVRDLLRSTFREIRTLVAGSSPTDTVALLNVQWIEWPMD
ncbi:MAG: DUF4423 domain-containing protein [Kofleriaceae bacterium]|nr:DUF4423 domain-containing protein [Kofleriaceae bacterium]